MDLAFVTAGAPGSADRLLALAAEALAAQGVQLAGVVQSSRAVPGRDRCAMDLRVLPDGPAICISQNLGAASAGCRLDAGGLEAAVAEVGRRLDGAELLLVNRFGKLEAEGRGFVPLIAEALSRGLPVLLAVNAVNRPAFDVFAAGLARPLPASLPALLGWAAAARAPAA